MLAWRKGTKPLEHYEAKRSYHACITCTIRKCCRHSRGAIFIVARYMSCKAGSVGKARRAALSLGVAVRSGEGVAGEGGVAGPAARDVAAGLGTVAQQG